MAGGFFEKWGTAVARAAIAVSALILAWATWAHWGSIQVDCGRELYVPLQILNGKTLYRDLWYPYGPLEPYAASGLIWLFGPHLNTFYLFGLAIATAGALLLFESGSMLASRAVGVAAALVFLVQGFGPTIFNYIFPYSYSAALALMFALLCLWLSLRHIFRLPGRNLTEAGLAASLALACKPEFGIACGAMIATVVIVEAASRRSIRVLADGTLSCLPGILVTTSIYGWFFWKVGFSFLMDNWVGPKHYFTDTYASHLYANGFDFSSGRIGALAIDAALSVLLWFAIAKLAGVMQKVRWRSVPMVAAILILASSRQLLPVLLSSLVGLLFFPVGMFLIVGSAVARVFYVFARTDEDGRRPLLAQAALGVFALVLAARVFAFIAPWGYSIYYDAPLLLAFLIVVSRCVVAATPSLIPADRQNLTAFLLVVEVLAMVIFCFPFSTDRTSLLSSSWGKIYLEPSEAAVARQVIDFVAEQKHQGKRVILLPELPMIYALTGTQAPSRLYTIQPGFLPPWQEDSYIAELEKANAASIILTNRTTPEYGVPYFGIDFDQKVYRWINANYRVAGEFGHFHRDGSRTLAALIYQREPLQTGRTISSDLAGYHREGAR